MWLNKMSPERKIYRSRSSTSESIQPTFWVLILPFEIVSIRVTESPLPSVFCGVDVPLEMRVQTSPNLTQRQSPGKSASLKVACESSTTVEAVWLMPQISFSSSRSIKLFIARLYYYYTCRTTSARSLVQYVRPARERKCGQQCN